MAISPSVAPGGNTSEFRGMTIKDIQVSGHGAAAAPPRAEGHRGSSAAGIGRGAQEFANL